MDCKEYVGARFADSAEMSCLRKFTDAAVLPLAASSNEHFMIRPQKDIDWYKVSMFFLRTSPASLG